MLHHRSDLIPLESPAAGFFFSAGVAHPAWRTSTAVSLRSDGVIVELQASGSPLNLHELLLTRMRPPAGFWQRALSQRGEKGLCRFEVGRSEALGKPAVDRSQEFTRLLSITAGVP